MKRKVIDELINWKTSQANQPILLRGTKGVGKTYLAYDFAKAFFEHICYLNFEREPQKQELFQGDLQSVIDQLFIYFKIDKNTPEQSRILILDEILFCEPLVSHCKSKQFQQNFPYVIAISSIPLTSDQINGFTVIPVYPLEFDEFLRATNNEWYIETIWNHYNSNKKIPDIVHKELLALHQLYLKIGGLPAMVNEYLNLFTTMNVSEQHNFLIGSYHDYILKNNNDSDAAKMNQVFDSLVYQLMKDNKKFQYKLIRKGTTHAMYKDAIHKLSDSNYVIRANKLSTEQLALNPVVEASNYIDNDENNTNFKLYLPDTGLLYTKIIEEQGSLDQPCLAKALLENYIAQSLQAKNYPFGFWESDSMAKIDFIIVKEDQYIPIEVFESDNTRSKNISIIKQKCNFDYSIKISSKNFDYASQIKYVPYYAVFCL